MKKREKKKWAERKGKDLNYDHIIISLGRVFHTNPFKVSFHSQRQFDFSILERKKNPERHTSASYYDDKFYAISLHKYLIYNIDVRHFSPEKVNKIQVKHMNAFSISKSMRNAHTLTYKVKCVGELHSTVRTV